MQSRDNQSHWIRKCNVCGDTFCDPITSKPHCGHNDFGFVEPSPRHNPHPTVKPIALARYLATLLLPPTEYAPRRLFVPFAGVGSEMIGAHQAGWEIIEGVELEDDSADIGRKRIDYWVSKPVQTELFIKSE